MEVLSGVIGHVKLLLIDSKVFAEEVEPTGGFVEKLRAVCAAATVLCV